MILAIAAKVLFGPDMETQQRTVKGMLDPLNSNKCNVHLLILILDATLVAIFPELALGSEVNVTEGLGDSGTPIDNDGAQSDRALTPTGDTP
jgi:hypothetical protein